jgi:hypothetical protein
MDNHPFVDQLVNMGFINQVAQFPQDALNEHWSLQQFQDTIHALDLVKDQLKLLLPYSNANLTYGIRAILNLIHVCKEHLDSIMANQRHVGGNVFHSIKQAYHGHREDAPPQIRQWLAKHGHIRIIRAEIVRKPLSKVIEKLANWISRGQYEANKRKLGYDKMVHLYVVFELENGSVWLIEKNEIAVIKPSSWNQHGIYDSIPTHLNKLNMTDTIRYAEHKVGKKNLWVYDHIHNNCQHFVLALLSDASRKRDSHFVKQDVDSVLKDLGYLSKISNFATGTASKYHLIRHGLGY